MSLAERPAVKSRDGWKAAGSGVKKKNSNLHVMSGKKPAAAISDRCVLQTEVKDG